MNETTRRNKIRRENDSEYIKFQKQIKNNGSSIWSPSDINYQNIPSNSWFDIQYYKNANSDFTNKIKKEKRKEHKTTYKCMLVDMELTTKQQIIFKRWMKTYLLMYNETLRKIKSLYQTTNELNTDYKKLRTGHLKDIKNTLILNSSIREIEGDTKIKAHILDGAIRLACANYKSALTNQKNGNIKTFRIRYWKVNKPSYVLDIEPVYFKDKSICPKIFGEIKCSYDGNPFNLDDIPNRYKTECKVIYNKMTGKFTLFVPIKTPIESIERENKVVSIDLGLRTFMTCLSENEVIKIGNNVVDTLKPYMTKINKLNETKCNNNEKYSPKVLTKKERKIENRCYLKMKNKVTDLHWKSIKYLTDRYDNILIGDLSIKGITKKDTSVLGKMLKRVGYQLSFYKLRQRLENKSISKGNYFSTVNERYTSKTCSKCGNYDDLLGSNKVYNCQKCNIEIDRDVNGCRGIYLKCT